MLQSLREETEGKVQMRLPRRENGLTSLCKEVRVFKVRPEAHSMITLEGEEGT